MEILKVFFPFSFKEKNDVTALVINIIIHVVAGFIIGVIFSLLGKIPLVGIIFGVVGGAIDLYILIGLVLSILDYFKILK